jgi:hypothetical protein
MKHCKLKTIFEIFSHKQSPKKIRVYLAVGFISTLVIFFYLKKRWIDSPNVNLIDLSQELLPHDLYNHIKCRKTIQFLNIDVTLCVYDVEKDIYMSANIWKEGIWEGPIIGIQ